MSEQENYGHECAECGDWTFEEGELCTSCVSKVPLQVDDEPCGCVPMRSSAPSSRQKLVRTNIETGAVVVDGLVPRAGRSTIDLVRERIAWCGTDNLGMKRVDARAAARRYIGQDQFVLGRYTFELRPVGSA